MPIVLVQPGVIKPNSTEYFAVCGLGGILSCGVTHCGVTPIDMVKCNKQNNPDIFKKGMFGNMGILSGIKGPKGLLRGWAPTFVGYSFQGPVARSNCDCFVWPTPQVSGTLQFTILYGQNWSMDSGARSY